MSLSYENLQLKVNELEEQIKELETELYFCRRNNKIEDNSKVSKTVVKCNYCNRNDGTCGCANR